MLSPLGRAEAVVQNYHYLWRGADCSLRMVSPLHTTHSHIVTLSTCHPSHLPKHDIWWAHSLTSPSKSHSLTSPSEPHSLTGKTTYIVFPTNWPQIVMFDSSMQSKEIIESSSSLISSLYLPTLDHGMCTVLSSVSRRKNCILHKVYKNTHTYM